MSDDELRATIKGVLDGLDQDEAGAPAWYCGKDRRLIQVYVRALNRIERALDGSGQQ